MPKSISQLIELEREAEQQNGLPLGTLTAVREQETGADHSFINDPTKLHGSESTAFGPYGTTEATAKKPGFGVDSLGNKSIAEIVRFTAQYLAGRIKSAGGDIEKGLDGYGTGKINNYGKQVLDKLSNLVIPEAGASILDQGLISNNGSVVQNPVEPIQQIRNAPQSVLDRLGNSKVDVSGNIVATTIGNENTINNKNDLMRKALQDITTEQDTVKAEQLAAAKQIIDADTTGVTDIAGNAERIKRQALRDSLNQSQIAAPPSNTQVSSLAPSPVDEATSGRDHFNTFIQSRNEGEFQPRGQAFADNSLILPGKLGNPGSIEQVVLPKTTTPQEDYLNEINNLADPFGQRDVGNAGVDPTDSNSAGDIPFSNSDVIDNTQQSTGSFKAPGILPGRVGNAGTIEKAVFNKTTTPQKDFFGRVLAVKPALDQHDVGNSANAPDIALLDGALRKRIDSGATLSDEDIAALSERNRQVAYQGRDENGQVIVDTAAPVNNTNQLSGDLPEVTVPDNVTPASLGYGGGSFTNARGVEINTLPITPTRPQEFVDDLPPPQGFVDDLSAVSHSNTPWGKFVRTVQSNGQITPSDLSFGKPQQGLLNRPDRTRAVAMLKQLGVTG